MRSTPHILVINGTKVRRPVFILGAPHSGTDLLARAIKQSGGFHLTAGRAGVLRVTYAFARRPSIATERERGAARVLRDSYAEAWQMSPRACAACPAECHRLAEPLAPAPPDPSPAGLRLFRRDGRDGRDPRDGRDARDRRDSRDPRTARDTGDRRDPREARTDRSARGRRRGTGPAGEPAVELTGELVPRSAPGDGTAGSGRWAGGAEDGAAGACVDPQSVHRFADASPDLLYSADVLLDAFPDAQLLQVIRDGRDVVADMLDDEQCLAWFKPGIANIDDVFPNPFFGIEEYTEQRRWPQAALAVKCALRWRGAVRLSARLRSQTPAEQLLTVRYEDLVTRPGTIAGDLSDYLEMPVSKAVLTAAVQERHDGPAPAWQERLTARQIVQVEKVAGPELRRLGYRLSGR